MGAKEFGKALREQRLARQWSQPDLADKSGVPKPTIAAYESSKVTQPGRGNVIKLALALDWPDGVDAALALLNKGPLSDVEREFLPVPAPVDLFADVTRLWPQLSPRLQAAVVELFNAICEPHGPVKSDPTARRWSGRKTIASPRESPDTAETPDDTRSGHC